MANAGLPISIRVVQLWRGTPLDERTFPWGALQAAGGAITIGATEVETFTTPETRLGGLYPLFRASPTGFTRSLQPGMTRTLHARGRTLSVGTQNGALPLGGSDWGIIGVDDSNEIAFYFELVAPSAQLPPAIGVDGFLVSGLAFSAAIFTALLVVAFLASDPPAGD